MIYLSGIPHPAIPLAGRPDLGVLITPDMGNRPDWLGAIQGWGADNACFTNPTGFSMKRYLDWLKGMEPWRSTCLFATAPDVVGDARATWERSVPALPLIRAAGWPPALVAQDGMENMLGMIDWSAFDALFVGGSTDWKLSQAAHRIVMEARRRGKWTHMGRVNSYRRLRLAHDHGCRSADGTFLRPAPDANVPRMLRWLDHLHRQPSLLAPDAQS